MSAIPPDTVIGQKYRINRRIGSGSFGEIYSGTVLHQESTQQVAIKFEKKSARCPQLRHEFKVYRELQGCGGIGRVMYYGSFRDSNVMVMELLGPSLEDLFNKCNRKFSLRTTLKLADQLLERVETLHENHLIHRDIKPANFVMGVNGSGVAYCIDFGLSKRFRHPHTLQHIPYREGRSLTGTPRYASVANHRGIETSRRDDLESIGYILVYFLLGKLPWQGLKLPPNVQGTASQKHQLILDKKQLTSLPELCRGCPREFQDFLHYCRELQFDAKPDVAYLRGVFRQLYKNQGFLDNAPWDWESQRTSTKEPPQGGTTRPVTPQPHEQQLLAQTSSQPPRTAKGPWQQEEAAGLAGYHAAGAPSRDAPLDRQQDATAAVTITSRPKSVRGYSQPNVSASAKTVSLPSSRILEPSTTHGAASSTPQTATRPSPSFKSNAAAVASIGSRPWTAATDTFVSNPAEISLNSPTNGVSQFQVTAQISRASPNAGLHHKREPKSDMSPSDARQTPRQSAEASSAKEKASREHTDHNGHAASPSAEVAATRPISSRDQVIISVVSKAAAEPQAPAHVEGRHEPTNRPSTAPGHGVDGSTLDGKDDKNSLAWRGADDDGRQAQSSNRSPQAWGDSAGGATRRVYRHSPRTESRAIRDGALKVSQHPGLVSGDATTSAAVHIPHQTHFVGGPLSLVRYRRTSKEHAPSYQRPQSGHAGTHHYARNGMSGGAYGGLSQQSKGLWGSHQQASRQTAWNFATGGGIRAKAPTRPASAIRSAYSRSGKAAVPTNRTRHLY